MSGEHGEIEGEEPVPPAPAPPYIATKSGPAGELHKLLRESDVIQNWARRGGVGWAQEVGFLLVLSGEPAITAALARVVRRALTEQRILGNHELVNVQRWMSARCSRDVNLTSYTADLFSDFVGWMGSQDREFFGCERKFSATVVELGPLRWRHSRTGRRGFRGISLKASEPQKC